MKRETARETPKAMPQEATMPKDKDIENKTSYAVRIGAVTDAARPLPLKKRRKK